ncbi:MAG TPA: peptidyl-prolyl cis-trans isomerase [Acidobacteriota bacterium]|nr:peptidyl-prolyl cis-trans isomerase [Acidobacteriota bacterium]
MKRFTGVMIAVLAGFFAVHAGGSQIIDRILVKVNDEIITLSELNEALGNIRPQLEARFSGERLEQELRKAEEDLLNNLIEEKLIYQKAVELEFIAQIEPQVTAEIQRVIKENNLKDTDELETALARDGQSMKEFRDYIERHVAIRELTGAFVGSRIHLLTPEIERYYKNNIDQFTTPEEVTLSEIVISTSDGVENARSRAEDIYRRLQLGESFATLASQFSQGLTANKGGAIGTYLVQNLNPNRVNIAGLKEGEVSKPLRVEDSYVIYRVDVRKEKTVQPLEEVRSKIMQTLYNQKWGPEYDRWIEQLKEEAYIQVFPEVV